MISVGVHIRHDIYTAAHALIIRRTILSSLISHQITSNAKPTVVSITKSGLHQKCFAGINSNKLVHSI